MTVSQRVHALHPLRALRVLPAPAPVLLLVLVMIADLFLGDLDIGPFSSRIYLLGALLALVAADVATGRRRLFATRASLLVAGAYALFILWTVFNRLYRGEDAGELVADLGSTSLYGLAVFIGAQAYLDRRKHLLLLLAVFGASAVLSSAFAIAQWANLSAAWEAAAALRPLTHETAYVRGLALYSVPLSYHVLTAGAVVVGWALWTGRTTAGSLAIKSAALSVLALALWLALARSAIAAGIEMLAAAVIIHLATRLGNGRRVAALVAVAAPVIVVAIVVNAFEPERRPLQTNPGVGYYKLDRATNFSATGRLALAEYALRSGLRHPWIGDAAAYAELAYPEGRPADNRLPQVPSAPHNMFLNTLVSYGFTGLVFLGAFLIALLGLAARALTASWESPGYHWIAVASVLGLAGYVTNAMFHNASFASGEALPWWEVAALAVAAAGARGNQAGAAHGPSEKPS